MWVSIFCLFLKRATFLMVKTDNPGKGTHSLVGPECLIFGQSTASLTVAMLTGLRVAIP